MAKQTNELNRQLSVNEAIHAQHIPNDPQIIRVQIEQTRTQMGQTIKQLQERLSPERIKQETQKAIRDVTIGKAQQPTNKAEYEMKNWLTTVSPIVFRAYLTIMLGIFSRIRGYLHKQVRKFWNIQPHFYAQRQSFT